MSSSTLVKADAEGGVSTTLLEGLFLTLTCCVASETSLIKLHASTAVLFLERELPLEAVSNHLSTAQRPPVK